MDELNEELEENRREKVETVGEQLENPGDEESSTEALKKPRVNRATEKCHFI